ncbi:hypothetical protein DSM3645_03668 [Blastopirellula marina DSM 3645]|uniref:Uncharacterized protein n=1 Tax=Blastopirellula marina DSM 3645 TaxID=314230 RepID=A3ZW45_9BACT|nr:hypothetical protein DSM3645_03668 [Blastopirellula marina DSM 3645]
MPETAANAVRLMSTCIPACAADTKRRGSCVQSGDAVS